jgi:hypothetical protein
VECIQARCTNEYYPDRVAERKCYSLNDCRLKHFEPPNTTEDECDACQDMTSQRNLLDECLEGAKQLIGIENRPLAARLTVRAWPESSTSTENSPVALLLPRRLADLSNGTSTDT